MSTVHHNEQLREAHHFSMGDLMINIGAPQQPSTINNFGSNQRSQGAPKSAPPNMSQSGVGSYFGGSAYPTPPASYPSSEGAPKRPAAPRVGQGNRSHHPRVDRSFMPPNPDVRANRTGQPSRPAVRPIQGLPTPNPSLRSSANVDLEEEDIYEEAKEVIVSDAPHPTTSPSGPAPRMRDTVFLADGAKAALENAMPVIQRFFSKAGLKNDEWIAQVGFDEEELFERNCYEEVIVFTILNPAVAVKSIDRRKLKSHFARFPVVIRSHSGEDRSHERETHLLANMAQHTASVSKDLPKIPDYAKIAFTAETGFSGLVDPKARLTVEASLAHKAARDHDGAHRSVEFSKLDFRMSGQRNPFFLKFAHVSVANGEKDVTVKKPAEVPRLADSFKETIANKTTESRTQSLSINASASPSATGQVSRTKGSETSKSSEQTHNHHWIDWEYLVHGVKVKYQNAKTEALKSQSLVENDNLPNFSLPISSSSTTETEPEDDIIKIRLTSFWTYRVDKDDVLEPEQFGALKRVWQRVALWRFKESNPKPAPGFTNFVHCDDSPNDARQTARSSGLDQANFAVLNQHLKATSARKRRSRSPVGIQIPTPAPSSLSPDRSTISGSESELEGEEDSPRGRRWTREVDHTADAQHSLASQPAPESIAPLPQLRHVIIAAEGAKTDLESMLDRIEKILKDGGIKRDQWIAQVGFDQEALSLYDRNFEYQEAIVITILDSSVKVKAIKMDELQQCLSSYTISRERRRGGNFENAAMDKLADNTGSRNLLVLPATRPDDAYIEVKTFDKLSQNHTEGEVATHFAFDIKKTENGSSIEFHNLSFTGPQLPNRPFYIQYGHVRVSGDGTGIHRAIQYPENQPGHGDDFKVIKAHKTLSGIVKKAAAKILGKSGPEVTVEYATTQGREDQEGEEWTKKVNSVHHEEVPGGWKLKFDTSALRRTTFRPPRKSGDSTNRGMVADFSLGRLAGPTQEERVTIKFASLWALHTDNNQVRRTANPLKRIRKDKLRKGKGKDMVDVESLPMFTNFVHLVEIVFPSNFSGIIADNESHSPGFIDFTLPTP
ncbi:hypothetical protein H1R20_g10062, partial [Candolleomyces eurysporus]